MKISLYLGVSLSSVAVGVSLAAGPAMAQLHPEQSISPLAGTRAQAPEPRTPEVFELPVSPEVPLSSLRKGNEGPSFNLSHIKVSEKTPKGLKPILTEAEIETIVSPYRNRSVTLGEVALLRDLLTQKVIAKGYITSGAEIENLDIAAGALKLELIRGQLTSVVAKDYGYLSSQYITARFTGKTGSAIKADDLQSQYQLLLEDRNIAALNAVLKPGDRRGEAILEIDSLKLKPRHELTVFVASDRSPSVGATRAGMRGRTASLMSTGDELSGEIGQTEGMTDARLNYSVPLRSNGLQFNLFVQGSKADIIEEPLNALDAASSSFYYGGGLSVPLIRKPTRSLILNTTVDRLRVKTELLGVPFSFSPGAVDGVTEYSTARSHLVYAAYGRRQSVVAGLSITRGLSAQNGTRDIDVHFTRLNASIEYLRVLTVTDQRLILRAQVQQTSDRLFSTEMLSIGGTDTVRGFRQNSLIGPKGYTASVEYQIPASDIIKTKLPRNHPFSPSRMRVGLFADTGHVDPLPGAAGATRENLSAVGARLIWSPTEHVLVAGHVAKRLGNGVATGNYQDEGFGFNLSYRF